MEKKIYVYKSDLNDDPCYLKLTKDEATVIKWFIDNIAWVGEFPTIDEMKCYEVGDEK